MGVFSRRNIIKACNRDIFTNYQTLFMNSSHSSKGHKVVTSHNGRRRLGQIEQLFTNCLPADGHPYFRDVCRLQVSSHLLIRRDGALVQFVPFDKRAWHAGQSCYQGRENCNDFSIGIELEGTDDSPFEPSQYQVLAQVIRSLLDAYPGLSARRIVGHSDIAPDRKTDPGSGFDWALLQRLLDDTPSTD